MFAANVAVLLSGLRGRHAARIGPTPLPHLLATGFAQQKIFQHEFAVASSKGSTADPAGYFTVFGGLWSGLASDNLIQPVAAWAPEKLNRHGSGYDTPPNSLSILSDISE